MVAALRRLDVAWHLLRTFLQLRCWPQPAHRGALLALQQRRLRRFLQSDLGAIPKYSAQDHSSLAALPVVDKAAMLSAFDQFNPHGITRDQALAAARRAEAGLPADLPGGLTAGLSSGTSGAHSVFLVSSRERGAWAGAVLATVLSPSSLRQFLTPWAPPLRVAFFLRASSALYDTVDGWRLQLRWLPLTLPVAEQLARLQAIAPQILVAPASVLGTLAHAQLSGNLSIAPRQVISVAEVLENDDVDAVVQAWGVLPSQIYQCTEGFMGASCEAGHVHLNEQYLLIEPEWLDPGRTRFRPLVTDFMRRSQAFVRFRLDDVLRPLPGPCACGRPTLALARIEGRSDERFWLPDASGELQPIYPDALRHAIARAQSGWPVTASLQDYRLTQHGLRWLLGTQPALDAARKATLVRALAELCRAAGLVTPEIVDTPWVIDNATSKRRRIRCALVPGTGLHRESTCAS